MIIASGNVRVKRFGYVCSILFVYCWYVEGEKCRVVVVLKVDGYVGTEGEWIIIVVRMVFDVRLIDGLFGMIYLYTFEAEDGCCVKMIGSRPVARHAGETLVVRGTVKKHGEYQGHKETTLTRVSAIASGEGEQMDAALELVHAGEVARPADDPGMSELGTAVQFLKRKGVWRFK